MGLKKILSARGIHYLATRFGPAWLRGAAFDEKFIESGQWRVNEGKGHELGSVVRQYLNKGDLLILGCGGASILDGLEADGLNSALGVDLSEEGLRMARKYSSEKVTFALAPMEDYECKSQYDVILFSESINYVRLQPCKQMLKKLAQSLKSNGVFIVTLSNPQRYAQILEMIRESFPIVEDRNFKNSPRHLIIFKG